MSPLVASDLVVAGTTVGAMQIAQYEASNSITAGPAFAAASDAAVTMTAGSEIRLVADMGNEVLIPSGCAFQARIGPVSKPTFEAFAGQRERADVDALRVVGPNPFNATITIEYVVRTPGFVRMMLDDARGQKLRDLVREKHHRAGTFRLVVNASELASGVYFCVLDSGDRRDIRKLTLIK
jgi:hypothetical protein